MGNMTELKLGFQTFFSYRSEMYRKYFSISSIFLNNYLTTAHKLKINNLAYILFIHALL